MSDAEIKDSPKDPILVRCLKLAAQIDWKSMVIVLAALAGFGGAVWNRIDTILEKTIQSRTQAGVYDVLVTRLDEIHARLEKLEAVHVDRVPLKPVPAKSKMGATRGPASVTVAAIAAGDEGQELPPVRKARFPSFEEIQQSAKQDRMPELLENAASPR